MSAEPNSYYRVDPARLKEARRLAMLTQTGLAEKSRVSWDTIRRIEQRSPRYRYGQQLSVVKSLANALAVSPRWLVSTGCPQGDEGTESAGEDTGEQGVEKEGNSQGNSQGTPRVRVIEPLALDLGVDLEPKALTAVTSKNLHPTDGAVAPFPRLLKTPKANGQPRPDQEMFASVAEVCGWPLDSLTDDARGRVNSAAKQLREVGATVEEVALFGVLYEQHWPGADLTPQAITNNWPTFKSGKLFEAARSRR